MKKALRILVLLFTLTVSGTAQKRPFSITASTGRTSRFTRAVTVKQFNFSINAAVSFKKRWSWQFGISSPYDFSGFTYRTGISFRIY